MEQYMNMQQALARTTDESLAGHYIPHYQTEVQVQGGFIVVDAGLLGSVARLFNHSCTPNLTLLKVSQSAPPHMAGLRSIGKSVNQPCTAPSSPLSLSLCVTDALPVARDGCRWRRTGCTPRSPSSPTATSPRERS